MKIGIIGAGFTGLSAAYHALKHNHYVSVFEKDGQPGGLAIGYQETGWTWTLEKHYHHWFTNDDDVLTLAKDIKYPVITNTPKTNWYVQNKIYRFDSIPAALSFPLLSPIERIRQLAALGLLRINPFWKILERFKTNEVMPKLMGEKAYSMLWESLLTNKFGAYADEISLAWFWARIKKRTQSLAYPEGGFLSFARTVSDTIKKKGCQIEYNYSISKIETAKKKIIILSASGEKHIFDCVIVTLPSYSFLQLAGKMFSEAYQKRLLALKGLGATNLVLRLTKPFFSDNTYWLSIADTNSPITAIVEHTNFMDKKHYNNEHLIYVGNYLPMDHPNFSKTYEEILKLYDPYLKKINQDYRKNLIGTRLFKAPFAQPIIPINYSRQIPPFQTPVPNLFLANMQQVYPWDRGTNYAVALGKKIIDAVEQKQGIL